MRIADADAQPQLGAAYVTPDANPDPAMIARVLRQMRARYPSVTFEMDMTEDGTPYGCFFTPGDGAQCCFTIEPNGLVGGRWAVRDLWGVDVVLGHAADSEQAAEILLHATLGRIMQAVTH